MSATITWSIKKIECLARAEGQTDVAIRADWMCYGTQQDGDKTVAGNVLGSSEFQYTQGSPFTPFNQLTEQQVLEWVWATFAEGKKADIETAVQLQIDNQITPEVVNPPLPWAQA